MAVAFAYERDGRDPHLVAPQLPHPPGKLPAVPSPVERALPQDIDQLNRYRTVGHKGPRGIKPRPQLRALSSSWSLARPCAETAPTIPGRCVEPIPSRREVTHMLVAPVRDPLRTTLTIVLNQDTLGQDRTDRVASTRDMDPHRGTYRPVTTPDPRPIMELYLGMTRDTVVEGRTSIRGLTYSQQRTKGPPAKHGVPRPHHGGREHACSSLDSHGPQHDPRYDHEQGMTLVVSSTRE